VFAALLMLRPMYSAAERVQLRSGTGHVWLATVMPSAWTHPGVLVAVMLGWMLLPFYFAHRRFNDAPRFPYR
jgi:Cu-processing system permease protein